jgi:hypothetical protein
MEQIAEALQEWVALYGMKIVAAAVILVLGRLAAIGVRALARRVLKKCHVDEDLISFAASAVYVAVMVFVVLVALGQLGIQVAALVVLAPMLYWLLLAATHIAIGSYIRRDAIRRTALLLDIPPWVWGLIGLTGGVLGLAAYWLANCCQFVRNQTINTADTTTKSTLSTEAAQSAPPAER